MNTTPTPSATTRLRHALKRTVRRGHELLGDQPVLLPLHLTLTPESRHDRTVTADTDLVIEGFPRSGNTYAVTAFNLLQPANVRVVSHVHIPAQVRRAASLHVPILVVFRRPADAVVSMAVADAHHRVGSLLRYWCHYHEVVLDSADAVLFASFEEVTADIGSVIDRLNVRFDTSFAAGTPDTDRVFAAIDAKQRRVHGANGFDEGVARPNQARADAQARRRAELADPALAPNLVRSEGLHRRLLGLR